MVFNAQRFGVANRLGVSNANFSRIVQMEIMAQYENACLLKDAHTVVDGIGGAYVHRLSGQSQATYDTRLSTVRGAAGDARLPQIGYLPMSTSPQGNVVIFPDPTLIDQKPFWNSTCFVLLTVARNSVMPSCRLAVL